MMTLIVNIAVTAIKLRVFMLLLQKKHFQSILSMSYCNYRLTQKKCDASVCLL